MKNNLFKGLYAVYLLALIFSQISGLNHPYIANAQRYVNISLPTGANVNSPTLDNVPNNNLVNIYDVVKYPAKKSVLRGQVFLDSNKNGIKENGEAGLSRSKVIVKTETEGIFEIYTDENGFYSIELYDNQEVRVSIEIEDSNGEIKQYEITTIQTGGTKDQLYNFNNDLVAKPVGVYLASKSLPPTIPVIIEKVVRTGGISLFTFPIGLIILFAIVYKVTLTKK